MNQEQDTWHGMQRVVASWVMVAQPIPAAILKLKARDLNERTVQGNWFVWEQGRYKYRFERTAKGWKFFDMERQGVI